MENVGIVVENLVTAIASFTELGLTLEGRATIEGDWANGVTGLHDMQCEIAMIATPVTTAGSRSLFFQNRLSSLITVGSSLDTASPNTCWTS